MCRSMRRCPTKTKAQLRQLFDHPCSTGAKEHKTTKSGQSMELEPSCFGNAVAMVNSVVRITVNSTQACKAFLANQNSCRQAEFCGIRSNYFFSIFARRALPLYQELAHCGLQKNHKDDIKRRVLQEERHKAISLERMR